jgi:FkbM family methyltransferase
VALDIGANIGRCTALAATTVGVTGRVYAFEPVPFVVEVLRTMARLRRFRQVVVVEAALANTNGVTEISVPLKDGWKPLVPIAHLGAATERDMMKFAITVRRLDDFREEAGIDRIDFIKCDTEGSEFAVFSGGLDSLARDLPSVVCEIYDNYLARQQVQPAAVFGIFDALGYRSYLVNPTGTLTPARGYVSRGDYLFVHPSRVAAEALRPHLERPTPKVAQA